MLGTMLAEVGSMLVGLALAASLYAGCATLWAIRRADARWADSGRNGVYTAAALLGLALLLLLGAFLGDQFQIRYVALHSGRDVPLYLKASALWAGQEGSLLVWSFLQSFLTALVVGYSSERNRHLVPWASIFLSFLTAFFSAAILFLDDPFVLQSGVPFNGQGLNPLLRHPGMVFHPPAMYLGYVGLAVPYAFALAALMTRRMDGWSSAVRRWTLIAWLFLGLGLVLGARWAYDVLGWGGYWGWDPVENAGLMPWLSSTALLHSMVIQEKRGFGRWWSMVLATLSFVLVLFGTFATRSGLIQSVHAFVRSSLGSYFLAAIALALCGPLALMVSRRTVLAAPGTSLELFSRDGMLVLTLVLLVCVTVSIFIGSVLPTLSGALVGRRFEAGPAWFDRVTGPQFGALVLIMGVCPLLGRTADRLRRAWMRGVPALLGAVSAVVAAALAGFSRPVALVSFAIVGLAAGTAIAELGRDLVRLGVRRKDGFWSALGHWLRRNQRRTSGLLVHTGVILLGLGVLGSRLYPFEADVLLSPGDPVAVGGYTLVHQGLREEVREDRAITLASIDVYRDGKYLTTLAPREDRYLGSDESVAIPALRSGLGEDLYLVLSWWAGSGSVRLRVLINPLIRFVWLGALILLAGGLVALWPSAGTPASTVDRRARPRSGKTYSLHK